MEKRKDKDLHYIIAGILMKELPEARRNIAECENILALTLEVLKGITLDSSE